MPIWFEIILVCFVVAILWVRLYSIDGKYMWVKMAQASYYFALLCDNKTGNVHVT